MPELVGKTALITGGTTGLGRAMAERFLDEGASVVITGRDARLGAEAETALARGAIRFLRADAGEPDQARASVEETVSAVRRARHPREQRGRSVCRRGCSTRRWTPTTA